MIKPKKHIAGDYFNYLVQARDTYVQYLIEHNSDLNEITFDSWVNDLNYKLFEEAEFEEFYLLAEDLFKYRSLHSAEYDLEADGSLPEIAHQGVIVVAIDLNNSQKTLILDGNHRKNTLLRFCPTQQVLVIEVKINLP